MSSNGAWNYSFNLGKGFRSVGSTKNEMAQFLPQFMASWISRIPDRLFKTSIGFGSTLQKLPKKRERAKGMQPQKNVSRKCYMRLESKSNASHEIKRNENRSNPNEGN